ncbi:MAG: hypothetical protein II366_02175 [Clostridia bacterium]|nr:hypothetical protein [Clostridia bacterium]
MVKGVNKNIIEVHDIENEYFDKAILFVKPEYALFDNEKLFKEARRYVKNADLNRKCGKKPPQKKRNTPIITRFAYSASAAALTAAVCYFLM